MDENILEFITEDFEDGFIENVEPADETLEDFLDEEFLLDDDSVLISDDDLVYVSENDAPEDVVNAVNDVITSSDVKSALPSDSGSLNGGTYNIYNITLTPEENITEDPEDEQIQEEELPEAVTETQYNIDDIYSKLDGISSDVSVLKSNNYNHSQNMEKIGLTVVGLCVALLGGLVAYSVFNHIRP